MKLVEIETPTASLTADEQRWLACWRRMDDRRRQENFDLAEADAALHPRHAMPTLIVMKGAQR